MQMMNVIEYWRNSLADAERLNLDLTTLNSREEISFSDIEQGILPADIVKKYFQKDKYKESQSIDVLLAPVIAYAKTEHGRKKGTHPNEMVPLWIPARLNREGRLHASSGSFPWIPRNFLEPCSSEIIPLGSLESLDLFLSSHHQPNETWADYWTFALDLFQSVTGQSLAEFKHEMFMRSDKSLVTDETNKQGMAKQIIELYDDIRRKRYIPPLLKRYASLEDVPIEPLLDSMDSILKSAEHLGQMSNEFPVSDSQRETIHHFLTLSEGEMLAVNGPPGTGKTTMLQSIVSTLWIKAAYERTEPPVIVVSSTNNQAVTNVIDSFGRIKEVSNPLEGRWIPNILSYGLYLASSRQKEKPDRHTVFPHRGEGKKPGGFPSQVETHAFVAEAETYYLEKSSSYAKTTFSSVKEAVDYLHDQLKQTIDEQRQIIQSYHEFLQVNKVESEKYPQGIEWAITDKNNEILQLQTEMTGITQLEIEWNQHLYTKPWWFTLLNFFSFKGYINEKRRLRNKGFFLSHGHEEMEEDEFTSYIQTSKMKLQNKLNTTQEELEALQKERQWFQSARNRWKEWYDKLEMNQEDDLLSKLDTSYRYTAFKLATHYWEGCWLLQMQEQFSTNDQKSNEKMKQETRWRRYAKLTPCFVSTLYMSPSFFTAESFPLYDFIDLLIIDEAGQVSPEVAGATFALAKKALIVGDTLQIEPVWNIPKAVDLSNIVKFKLASTVEEADSVLSNKYIGASSGSVMHIAQRASKYQRFEEIKGMYLTEHRRCVPEIINYCNRLAYKGRLIPKRSRKEYHPLPHLGYAHVRGSMERFGGSLCNQMEADVIANWIVDNQVHLEKMYPGQELKDIIAVVTPFSQQRKLIQTALNRAKVQNITVGTVHALQGAERPIVIFSPVYDSSKEGGYFFDKGINMLNVAVSRAKDSFLVFGDMQIFDASSSLPSGILAQYLFADEGNEIKNIRIPSRALSNLGDAVQHIRELEEHRRILKECVLSARKEIHIVSPFLSSEAIEADHLQEIFEEAVRNGTKVTVYTDKHLNEQNGKPKINFIRAKEILLKSGVQLVIANRIHNKTLWIDDWLLIEGSFNWLSARRSPDDPWCRYEASLVYKGDGVEGMIQQIYSDLQKRKILLLT
jgi:energy-coupling factor transporter ATP-binding protein EcfA2